ncbi:MAG: hypothetical protein AB7N76_37100 [Planctomycetota bacterium]
MGKEDRVELFGQQMTREWAEALQETQLETHYVRDGQRFERVAYGDETFRDPVEAESQPCRHCSTIRGKLHLPDCDYEQCPACAWQIMSCDCEFAGHEWKDLEDD